MGPLSDPELDGWLRELGLPAASAPTTSSVAVLGQAAAPVVGLVGWKLAAAVVLSLGAGFGGGVLSQARLAPPGQAQLAPPGQAPPGQAHLADRSPKVPAPHQEMARPGELALVELVGLAGEGGCFYPALGIG